MSSADPSGPLTAPGPERAARVFELIVAQQADPATACAYLGTGREGLRAELDDLDVPWPGSVRVGVEAGHVVAAVFVEHDEETGRSWVHGPWATDDGAWDRWAQALLDAAVAQTPEGVEDHELCAPPANRRMAALAEARGWPAGALNISYLARSTTGWPESPSGLREARADDIPAVTMLHDEAFPGTYATARHLLDDPDRITVVLDRGGEVVGYASAEVQADGEGYLDFVAVAQAVRGHGLGRSLVAHVGRELLARPGPTCLWLTVKGSNEPAIALYESLGFVRDAELVGYRSRAPRD